MLGVITISGENEARPSAWTVDSLKSHFDDQSVDSDRRYQQRFDAQQEALSAALLAAEKAVNAALVAAEKAVIKAENASERRFDGVNEFRQALSDQSKNQITRAEAAAQFAAIAEQFNGVSTQLGAMLPREVYDQVLADFSRWRTTVDVSATGFLTINAFERYLQRQHDEQVADRRQRTALLVGVAVSVAGTLFTLIR